MCRAIRTFSVLRALCTISCTVLITWHEGHLSAKLHRLRDSVGRRRLP